MFTEAERQCLFDMARKCRARGLSQAETELEMAEEIGRFSAPFRIRQAAQQAFTDAPQDSEPSHSAANF